MPKKRILQAETFEEMLFHISREFRTAKDQPNDLEGLKAVCATELPQSDIDGSQNANDLFKLLLAEESFSQENMSFFVKSLKNIGRSDLASSAESWVENHKMDHVSEGNMTGSQGAAPPKVGSAQAQVPSQSSGNQPGIYVRDLNIENGNLQTGPGNIQTGSGNLQTGSGNLQTSANPSGVAGGMAGSMAGGQGAPLIVEGVFAPGMKVNGNVAQGRDNMKVQF